MSPLVPASAMIAALALAAPASAQPLQDAPGMREQVGTGVHPGPGDRRRPPRDVLIYGYGSPEGWAYFNNRSFAPDSYNDWWHDRPDRSFPRWVSQNGGCQRVWWSGGGWRC